MQSLSFVCLSLFLGMIYPVNSLKLELSCEGSHVPGKCVYEEGETILINCSIVSFPSNYNPHNDSSYLLDSIYVTNGEVTLNYTVQRVSANTMQFIYHNEPMLKEAVVCKMLADGKVVTNYKRFYSTRKPNVPTLIGCGRNTSQDTVTCSWSPTLEVENRNRNNDWNFSHTLFWRFNQANSDGSDLDWQRCPNASDGICRWDDVSQFFNPDNGELCVYVVAQSVSNENDHRPMTPHASQETCHDLHDIENPNHQITGLTGGDIAGIVCGAALIVCMVVMGIVAFRCCRRRWAKFVDGVKIEVPEAVTPNKCIQNYSKTNGYTVNGNDPSFLSKQPKSPFLFFKDAATSPTVDPLLKNVEYENEAIGVQKADDYSKYHVLIASDDVNDDEEDTTSYVRSYATVPSQDMSLLKNPVGAPGALVEPRLGESNPLQGNDLSVEYGLVAFDGVGIAPPGTTYYNVGDDVIQPQRNKMAHSPSTETTSSMESQPISNYITVEMVSPATSPTPQCDLISLNT